MTRRVSIAQAFLVVALTAMAVRAGDAPKIFWASDPVRPGETVVLQGANFGTNPVVRIARVTKGTFTNAESLQHSDTCLKFEVPADWEMKYFVCRVLANGESSEDVVLNYCDSWWIQGDQGAMASPGGWMLICGRGLNLTGESGIFLMTNSPISTLLVPARSDGYSLKFGIPRNQSPGKYLLDINNGISPTAGWQDAGSIVIEPAPVWPTNVFSVVESMGAAAEKEMRKSLVKYRDVKDCTAGIQAALKKAKDNGGGIVYFPAGRYGITNEIALPPKTILRGEGEGLVVLWWGSGRFNLDGGSDLGYARKEGEAKPPANLISGRDFTIENMSLYVPPDYQTVIDAQENVRIRRVRMRIDHYWTLHTQRYDGWFARLGKNCEVTDCDIQAKGGGISPGTYCWIARNKITAGKVPCPLGGARQVIVEDNEFISTHPTAYQNIAGHGKNIYYARNTHTALNTHQADFSFTFDTGMSAYCGKIAEVSGTNLVLAADPAFPTWAKEDSRYWKEAVVCILDGKGAGQYRDVTSNRGRAWTIDRPFDVAPDATSTVTIVPFNGRILVIGNRFEDANWVNAGFGTSIDVIYANNKLVRCAQLLNHGLETKGFIQPSWYVQYLDNELCEGQTSLDITGDSRGRDLYDGPITRCVIARRNRFAPDNSGSISVGGNARDVLVEASVFSRPESFIKADGEAAGLVFRNNRFEAGPPRIEGGQMSNAVVVPAANATAK